MANYYVVLGVEPQATLDEIKKAFRKLALSNHPDRNPGNKAAEERFKLITEAYETLADSDRRQTYDLEHRSPFADYSPDPFVHMDEDLREVFSDLFDKKQKRGRNLEARLEISFEESYLGTTKTLVLVDTQKQSREINVRIPPGVGEGKILRVKGQGEKAIGDEVAGDLIVHIRLAKHPFFERQDQNIFIEIPIPLATAILGGEIEVPTLEGAVKMKIPKGVQSGKTLRLRGKGFTSEKKTAKGDQYVRIHVETPQNLNANQIATVKKLQSECGLEQYPMVSTFLSQTKK